MAMRRRPLQIATLVAASRRQQLLRGPRQAPHASSHLASVLMPVAGGILLTLVRRPRTFTLLER